jgi:histidinol-phosphate aminotransferase
MTPNLPAALRQEFLKRGFSRRNLMRIGALMGGGAALPFYNESALAQLSYVDGAPPDAVLINANENPLGPCPEALEAMNGVLKRGGRYMFGESMRLSSTLAGQEGVGADYVQAYAGSSDPLHRVVLAFTSPARPFVVADPGYEAGERAAHFAGAKAVKVPLTKAFAHDVRAMVKAAPNAGVFYICNPNNPTGTLTSREDIEWLVKNKPAGSIVLLDEAYIHFSDAPRGTDLVAKGEDVIVLRTFSKIYGMAGLRAGAAIARPELLEKIRIYGSGFLPTTGMVGATVSLNSKNLVPARKAIVKETREDVFAWLEKKNYAFTPSVSNCFMVDVKRPGQQVARAMAQQKVIIGRAWPVWPTYVRITVGTPEEMRKFKSAFEQAMT